MPRFSLGGPLVPLLALLVLPAWAGAARPPPPAPPGDGGGTYTDEVVTLPPYELDAVEPPWARDTRTAVTSAFLPRMQAQMTMVDALRGFSGVHIDQPGGAGGRSSLYLRGGEENYTVVLLDGVPVNNPLDSRGGGFDFGTLDASEFALAEIVRGPVSARYGPDALSGVIKLTSDVLGAPDGSKAIVGGGGRGLEAANAATSVCDGGLTAAVSGHWLEDGDRTAANHARHESMAAGATWQGRAVEWRVSAHYGRQESAAFPDDSGGRRLAVLRSLEERSASTTTAAIELLAPGAGIRWRARAWAAWLHADDDSPGVAPGARDPAGLPATSEATTLRRAGLSAEAAASVGGGGTLAVGIDGQTETGRSEAILRFGGIPLPASFAATRDRVGAFAEYTLQPAAGWLIQPSVRVDETRGFGSRATPRMGMRVPMAPGMVLRLNAGDGFKLPSFYALSNPLVGNPALKPEKARAADLGIEQQFAGGRGTFELGGFANRFRDGIDFDPGPPPRLVNRNEIRSDGLEASLRLAAGRALEWRLAGTYADIRSEPGGKSVRGRPRAEGSLRVLWRPTGELQVEASMTAVGRVFDSSVPTGDVLLPGWRRVDLAARWQIRRDLTATAAIDNLLNARYEEAVGVTSPGVRLRGGLEARF
ncbi:MAG TPA: TonB-dependent receptor [Opitutaceae bacterium]|nr:TonB-dependent receptor [Opitutaceae bacterium]